MRSGMGAGIVSRLLVVHRKCTRKGSMRISILSVNKKSVNAGKEIEKQRTSGPRI